MSNFSFCPNVFKSRLLPNSQKASVCGLILNTLKTEFLVLMRIKKIVPSKRKSNFMILQPVNIGVCLISVSFVLNLVVVANRE